MHRAKKSGRPVLYLRQDNTGKNLKLVARCKSADWKLNLKVEYTAKKTPQQNSQAETYFTTIAARARAMMAAANVPTIKRYKLFREAANTAAKIDLLTIVTV